MTAHTCTQHQPGETCYQVCDCRCEDCRAGWNRYRKLRQLRIAQGRPLRVPAETVAAHVRACLATMSVSDLAARASCSRSVLARIVDGRQRHVYRATAERLLAVPSRAPMARGFMDSCGVRRRIEALMIAGWPQHQLTAILGRADSWCRQIVVRPRVTLATHALVCDLYDRLWDVPGPSKISAQRARLRGFAVAAAWDDSPGPHFIDDPAAEPWRPQSGCDRRRIDMIADAAHQGRTVAEVAAEIGVQPETIYTACHRAGELDLWERLTDRSAA